MLHLLFNRKRVYLGEVLTKDGAFVQSTLSGEGEREIGALVKLWQTKGVPIRKEISSKDATGKTRQLVFYKEYVQTRLKKFQQALGMWASDYEVTVIDCSDRLLPFWQMLIRLPLETEERFAFFVALTHSPESLLPDWKKGLEEAERLVQHQGTESTQHVKVLQKRMAMEKANPFGKQ